MSGAMTGGNLGGGLATTGKHAGRGEIDDTWRHLCVWLAVAQDAARYPLSDFSSFTITLNDVIFA